MALNKLSQYLDESQVTPLFLFFVPDALNDRHTEVRRCMLDAALSALNTHGKVAHASLLKHLCFHFPPLTDVLISHFLFCVQDNVSSLLPVFEEFLKNAPQDASYDSVRQSVVILMGSLAKHLDKNDPKVKPIVAKLITALSTPSQQVRSFTSVLSHGMKQPCLWTVERSPYVSWCLIRSRSLWPAVCLLWFLPSKKTLQGS